MWRSPLLNIVARPGAELSFLYHQKTIKRFVFIVQACICANRVLVQDSTYDIFVDTLAKTMEKELRIGDGFDPKSTQGPLINQRAVEKVH